MDDLIKTLEMIATRMDYILVQNSERNDAYMLRKDMKELLTEIQNRVKQENAQKENLKRSLEV